MAVTPPTLIGAVSDGRNPSGLPGNVLTFSHTVPPGTEALIFLLNYDTFTFQEPTVTWNGIPMPRWHSPHISSALKPCLYILLSPPPGTGNVVSTAYPFDGGLQAGAALNVANFGGVRWAEYPFATVAPPSTVTTHIYTESTDLLIDLFAWAPGATAAPAVGQTPLVVQTGGGSGIFIGCSQGVPLDQGLPPAQPNYSTMGWTVSPPFLWTHYVLAIKGLDDAAPEGVPPSIGRMTNTDTLDQQPPPGVAVIDTPWRWRHEIPSTHTFLVVTTLGWDTDPTDVFYQPDGDSEIALTLVVQADRGGVYILPNAPVGFGYLRVVLANARWYGASAYSLSTDGLIAAVARIGVATTLNVPSEPDAIVVDHIGNLDTNWRSFLASAPQDGLFYQPIVGNGNPFESVTSPSSIAGAGSWRTADSTLTPMTWTLDATTTTSHQVGFSFIGINPPPPECPGRRAGTQIGA